MLFERFFRLHPALILGVNLLLGTAFVLVPHPIYPISCLMILIPFWKRYVGIFCLTSFLLGALLASYRVPCHNFPQEKFEGVAIFKIQSLKFHESPFQKSYVYQGVLKKFQAKSYQVEDLPCQIFVKIKDKRYAADHTYELRGSLEQKKPHLFIFKTQKNIPWKPLDKTYSLAELRFKAKRALSSYLSRHIAEEKTAHFLHALATGEVDERILSTELGKVGLQHLLAVSGFHFGILSAFLSILFQQIASRKIATYLLIGSLTIYWIFLGNSPSVERAWISLSLLLVGKLFGLRISGLNALGVSLMVCVIKDPLVPLHMGFQLSFLCTLAILLCYPMMTSLLEKCFPSRTLTTTLAMPVLDQYGYIALSLLKKAFSLNLAVHLVTLIPLLFLFHRFPLMSLAYNLFFPLWVSISLFLLCLGLLFFWIPPLSHCIHSINGTWTHFTLKLSSSAPATLDFVIRTADLTMIHVVLFLTLLFLGGIAWQGRQSDGYG